MIRAFSMAAALGLLTAASVCASEFDARCRAYDHAATERIKLMLDHSDAHTTTVAYSAVSHLTSARIECGQGRIDTALTMYRQLQRMLERAATTVSTENR